MDSTTAALLVTITLAWRAPIRLVYASLVVTLLVATFTARIETLGLLWIFALAGSLYLARWARPLGLAAFAALVFGLSDHMLAGFNNLKILDHVHLTPLANPFTLYLNLDKPVAALFVFLYFVRPDQSAKPWLWKTLWLWLILVLLMLPLTLVSGYVDWEPKIPECAWIWAVNNLFLVAFAEEAVFRGGVQGGLARAFPRLGPIVPVGVAAALFGLAHYQGGPAYIAFATIAGVFYGAAYWSTRRLQASITVHFLFNLTHFLLFTYPSKF